MSSDSNDTDQKPPSEEEAEPSTESKAYTVIKILAVIFLGVPLGLIVVIALVFGICMLAA